MLKEKMSSYYFPTTVVTIDDNTSFLDTVNLKLRKISPCKSFRDPVAALSFLFMKHDEIPISERCFMRTDNEDENGPNIVINIQLLHEHIYCETRFEEISVVIVDYTMPEMNGADFCEKLKDSRYKTILLTGEAGSNKAIELFNNKVIDGYIHKDEPDYLIKLIASVQSLQKAYFLKLSEVIIKTMTKQYEDETTKYSALSDPIFIHFFNNFIKKNKITEYYLLDEVGSFLLLNSHGETSWLIVKNEDDMAGSDYDTSSDDFKITPELRKAIQDREVLKFISNHHYYHPAPDDPKMLSHFYFPASRLEGKHTYYYSHIKKIAVPSPLNEKSILSYHEYLKTMD